MTFIDAMLISLSFAAVTGALVAAIPVAALYWYHHPRDPKLKPLRD